jgi:D-xylose transport system permease protein
MSRQANETNVKRPPTNADVAPPRASGDAEAADAAHLNARARLGNLRLPTAQLRAYTMLFALVAIWLYFQWATADPAHPYGIFLGAVNFSKLLQQMAVTGVLAVGMLMVIVAGQIDLSVGAVVGLSGGIAAMTQDWGLAPALGSAVVVGCLIGLAQGSLVAYANIPAFIVTLGGLLAWRGVILGLTEGSTISVTQPVFRALGRDPIPPTIGYALAALAVAAIVLLAVRRGRGRRRHGLAADSTVSTLLRVVVPSVLVVAFVALMNAQRGVPIPVAAFIAVAVAGAFLTQHTTFGRYLYAIGGNPDAARLSGISLRRHILAAFCLMGALAGVAALLHTGRVTGASPDSGTLMELDAIAACVIGGTSLMGGRGTVFGACVGALIMASLDNGMSLLNVESWVQMVVKGAVLVAAVGFDMLGRRGG